MNLDWYCHTKKLKCRGVRNSLKGGVDRSIHVRGLCFVSSLGALAYVPRVVGRADRLSARPSLVCQPPLAQQSNSEIRHHIGGPSPRRRRYGRSKLFARARPSRTPDSEESSARLTSRFGGALQISQNFYPS